MVAAGVSSRLTNYNKGRAAEYKVRDYLRLRGYNFSIRSAGSHGPIDLLVANGSGTVLAVQVKRNSSPMSDIETINLASWAGAYKAYAILVRVKKGKICMEYVGRPSSREERKVQMICIKNG